MTLHVSGCTTLSVVPYGNGGSGQIREGERVVVTTPAGARELQVTKVSADEICENDQCVRSDQVERVERKEVSVLKTAGAVLMVTVLVAVVVALHSAPIGGLPAMGL
jgi:hypothetical protein